MLPFPPLVQPQLKGYKLFFEKREEALPLPQYYFHPSLFISIPIQGLTRPPNL